MACIVCTLTVCRQQVNHSYVASQLEGSDGNENHLGTEYYTTLRSEADQDLSAATVASEEAQGDISRYGKVATLLCVTSVCLMC